MVISGASLFNADLIQTDDLMNAILFVGILVAVLTIFLTVRAYRRKASTGIESMIGERARVVEWKNSQGRVRLQGEIWQAFSDHDLKLKKDDRVIVVAIDELNIKIDINL